MSKQISIVTESAYESFVSSLIAGDGEFYLNPSQVEALPPAQEIDFTEECGDADSAVIVTVDDSGNVKEFAYYPADVQVVKYFD